MKDGTPMITKVELHKILYKYAENKILNHKQRLRNKQLDQINYKLHSDGKFHEKNELIEFQIETQMKEFNRLLPTK